MDEIGMQQEKHGHPGKPVLVKIAPDLTDDELELTVQTIKESGSFRNYCYEYNT